MEGRGILGLEGVHLIKWRGVAYWDWMEGVPGASDQVEGRGIGTEGIKWRGVALGCI